MSKKKVKDFDILKRMPDDSILSLVANDGLIDFAIGSHTVLSYWMSDRKDERKKTLKKIQNHVHDLTYALQRASDYAQAMTEELDKSED